VAIGIAAVVSSFFFLSYPFASNNQTVPSSMPSPQTSTIIIPKDSEDPNSGKNFEPQYLVVVLGLNNTVRWLNEAIVGNTVVADNQDDPLFWNATNYPFNGIIIDGKSLNFTFTKLGEFGYHAEPHPWLQGSVLVLPQSTENATQTVVLNGSSNIQGPCEIFGIPCPNNPNFTAQKLGANIYIEKMTVNGVDHYAIIHNSNVCVYPPSTSESCTNPDDLAILRFAGVAILNSSTLNSVLHEQAGHICIGGPVTCHST
jgi:plastocyanin